MTRHHRRTSSRLDGGRIDFTKTGVAGPSTFDTFGCDVFHENPRTPDRLRPDVSMTRQFYGSLDLTMPDGKKVRFWGFADPDGGGGKPFPSAPIRVRQGQIVHTTIKSSKGTHTIHLHGIQPTPFNDGVGHTSFEVSGQYTYQWQAYHAGTFFYHCHKNTVLHFEMGMYGMLIVDPPEGPGRLFSGGPHYDVEAIWVPDDVDPAWRLLDHDAGLCGEDHGLNNFNPEYFLISGVPNHRTMTDPRVAVSARVGQRVLIRLLNASYSILRVRFGIDIMVHSVDGVGLGSAVEPWSRPFLIPAGEAFELTSAQRYGIIVTPVAPGVIPVDMEFLHWIRRDVQAAGRGVARTVIKVTA